MSDNGNERQAKDKSDFTLVGSRMRKVDGQGKVQGRALYTDDIELPGMLHAKILRSPHPHARIVSIDTAKAEALPGVAAVVTGRDMPTTYGVIPWTPDEYPLCLDRVRYIGDGVAAVAAVDEDTAIEALELIEVEYEELPAFFDPFEALEAGDDPDKPYIHDARKPGWNGNVTKKVNLDFGEVDEGLAAADVVVGGDYFFEGTTHTPIEPHCAIGLWEPDGIPAGGHAARAGGHAERAGGAGGHAAREEGVPGGPFDGGIDPEGEAVSEERRGKLTVWSSTQVPHYLHRELARVLELDPARVRVLQPPVGGGFGGKSEPFDLEFCVAKLAMKAGRPVKLLYTREEVFYSHRGRHPFHMKYRTGVTRDGKLTAVDAKTLLDGGAYASFGLVTTYYSGQLLTAPYHMPAYRFDSTRVYTNKPACGPKRGHGSVQPRFAFEVQLDKLAEAIDMDPIELRRVNFMGENTRTVNELRVTSNGFLECLESVERASDWRKRYRRLPFGRGLGVAGSCYISGTNYPVYPNDMPQSAVQIQIDRSGRVAVFSGASEIGQGTDSMVAYLAAEELGVPLEYVRVYAGDTDFTPVDLGAYSSRVTFMLGNACLDAARKLRKLVQDAVADEWECRPKEVLLAGGRALFATDTARQMPIREAFNLAEAKHGTLGAVGSYNTPKDVHGSYRGGTIGASPAYSFTAHVAEVEVDVETGFVRVDKIWVAHDCGRALNPVLVEGQMEGSAYMGFGEALMEEQLFKDADHGRAGLHNAPSLLDYRIPTSLDTPELESLIVESIDPEGPYGAKEAGEGPLHPSIPAIANAIYDAVGVRMDSLPFSPPRVWRKLEEAKAKGDLVKPPVPSRNGAQPIRSDRGEAEEAAPDAGTRSGRSTPTGAGPLAIAALLLGVGACGVGDSSEVEPAGTERTPAPATYAGPVLDLPPVAPDAELRHETERDWVIARGTVEWARAQGLDQLPVGEVLAIVGSTFVGAPYEPGTLELPGPERLVVNLRTMDCVTFVEQMLVLARLTVEGPDPADEAAFQAAFRDELTRMRYRGGALDGYLSRLHYFSEWIQDGEAKGLVSDVTAELGGVVDGRPISFMTEHTDAYRQLHEDPSLVDPLRAIEGELSARTRHYIPQDRIREVESGIRNGDVIAAVSTVGGLDIAHTGLAIWHDGRVHLMHAPLVGDSVEISERPLAERIQRISGQQGIIVARPLDPGAPPAAPGGER